MQGYEDRDQRDDLIERVVIAAFITGFVLAIAILVAVVTWS